MLWYPNGTRISRADIKRYGKIENLRKILLRCNILFVCCHAVVICFRGCGLQYHYSWRFPVWKFYHIRLSYWELAVAPGFWLQKIRQHSFFRMLPSFCFAPIRRLPYTSYIEIWRLKFNVWIARSSSSGWGVRQGRRPKSYPLFPAELPLASVWIPLPLNLALNNRTSRLQKAILNL